MKIQCDVCNKDEASVFCTADEAALCGCCDHRVHHANKLASKHPRFSLLCPSPKEFPLCDVCQERRAFLFCQQDRAILCRECDLPIHTANEHTQKHNRFLLTGVKLSATSEVYTSAPSDASPSNGCDLVPDFKSEASSSVKKPVSASGAISGPRKAAPSAASAAVAASTAMVNNTDGINNSMLASQESGSNGSTSSISEYLIEMLPGWHFEDVLDSCSASLGFCKKDDSLLPFADNDLERDMSSFSSKSSGIWVPQAPTPVWSNQFSFQNGGIVGGSKQTKEPATTRPGKRWNDDVFAVPEISPSSAGFKRSRPF
ncbi:B-box zinc finger protein 20-like [Rhodamnia argentea]|uniref:B-box zinc finger protein 20-like n=1 Tax=Rhodamnia argentea TaxID=178133 RepID=A0A8B8NXS1_9MYRT|nr:B-box zinc finger protein 20-like [Rhodamnia argentea]